MKKYRITAERFENWTETKIYEFEVEADSKDEAEEIAGEMIRNDEVEPTDEFSKHHGGGDELDAEETADTKFC